MPRPDRRLRSGLRGARALGAAGVHVLAAMLALVLALVLALAPRPAAAQTLACGPNDVEVRKLGFTGNHAFSDAQLAQVIVTMPSSAWRRLAHVGGTRRCLDHDALRDDVIRLLLFYTKSGYQEAKVDTTVTPVGRKSVAVTFRISEGRPIILDSLTITGLDSLPPARRAAILKGLDLRAGRPFNKYRLLALVDTISGRLLDNGYPNATVLTSYDVDKEHRRGSFQVQVAPGALARIGRIYIERDTSRGRDAQISDAVVRRLLGIRPGSVYRRRDLINAQRNLYVTDAYRHVEVGLATDSLQSSSDSLVNVVVRLAEGDMHQASLGVGWATIDCIRSQGSYTDRNFLGGARRLELNGRVSKIGIPIRHQPADGQVPLCRRESWNGDWPDNDVLGDSLNLLNYYAAATFRQPTFFGLGPRALPSVTLYSERRSEYKTYQRYTPIGGVISITREPIARIPLTLSYSLERGRTYAQEAMYCAVFRTCEPEAIRAAGEQRTLAVASAVLTRDRTDNLFSPTSGSLLRVEGRYASRLFLSDSKLQFRKAVGDASVYRSIGGGAVLAARLRLGAVQGFGTPLGGAADQAPFIPPQERLYAGGPQTVRGYRQNELGPAVYIVRDSALVERHVFPRPGGSADTIYTLKSGSSYEQAVPTGGNRLLVANLELRLRSPIFPELLQWVPFVDAGQVWNVGAGQSLEPRVTPGISFRFLSSFLGPVGVNVGYNWYARPKGPLYFSNVSPDFKSAPLVCASPAQLNADGEPVVTGGRCPDYAPKTESGFWRRLTFDFSIGQAF